MTQKHEKCGDVTIIDDAEGGVDIKFRCEREKGHLGPHLETWANRTSKGLMWYEARWGKQY